GWGNGREAPTLKLSPSLIDPRRMPELAGGARPRTTPGPFPWADDRLGGGSPERSDEPRHGPVRPLSDALLGDHQRLAPLGLGQVEVLGRVELADLPGIGADPQEALDQRQHRAVLLGLQEDVILAGGRQ